MKKKILIFVIIDILIILAIIGYKIYDSKRAEYNKLKAELKNVQVATFYQYSNYRTSNLDTDIIYTQDYSNEIIDFVHTNYKNVTLLHIPVYEDRIDQKYYYVTPSDLETMGLPGVEHSYIINYSTGEAFNADLFSVWPFEELYSKKNEKVITSEKYIEEINNSELPILVMFEADWCSACKGITPMVDQIGLYKEGKLKIIKLFYDDNKEFFDNEYNIKYLPTFIIYKDGELKERIEGSTTREELLEKLGLS